MNYLVLALAVVAGFVISALIWWMNRSLLASLCVLVLIVGLVAIVLPWDVGRIAQNQHRRGPEQGESDASLRKTKFSLAELEPYRPVEVTTHGYVGSAACQECHVENHASWKASYHRTMTQVARPEAILGNFDHVRVTHENREYFLSRNDETCMVDMPDLTVSHDHAERISAPIVMTTGSHHMQVYWFATGAVRMTGMLPLVYLNETQEWIPREAAFLRHHPNQSFETGRWNDVCSKCHATHRKSRLASNGDWDTHVAEFGISCEACHGPGQNHIDFRRGLEARSSAIGTESVTKSDPIVNPATLSKVRSAQVCGQCHSVSSIRENQTDDNLADVNLNGHSYQPGKDLLESHLVLNRDSPEYLSEQQLLGYEELETLLNETYYRDGMIRVTGREYNSLIDSSCYKNGEMTCLSCHQMHKSESDSRSLQEWANDQLQPEALGDAACLQCHQADQYSTQHTHHNVGSSGASCYNCHMPHSVYGLLKAIRNHTISSPNIAKDNDAHRPNACNLCHLDKTLQWSAQHLDEWYGIEPPEFDADQREVAASLLWLLRGDAAERALAAWSMGWDDVQNISGNDWQTPFLAQLLDDRYEAIRLIARRSLRTVPGLSDVHFDVVTSSTSPGRHRAILAIWKRWLDSNATTRIDRPELLIEKTEGIQVNRIDRLLDQRDNTPINLVE